MRPLCLVCDTAFEVRWGREADAALVPRTSCEAPCPTSNLVLSWALSVVPCPTGEQQGGFVPCPMGS